MKRTDGIFSLVALVLVTALLLALCSALSSAQRQEPENPIASEARRLEPESFSGDGATAQNGAAEPQESTQSEEPEPSQEPTQPTDEPKTPEVTQDEPRREEPTELPDGGETEPDDEKDGDGGITNGETEDGESSTEPRIFTDLKTVTLTKNELPDGILHFVAYPVGDGEDLSVRVRLKNESNPGNGTLLHSEDGRSYQAALDFNMENTFVLTLWEGDTLLGTVLYRVGYYADKASAEEPEVGDYPPSVLTNLDGETLEMSSRSFPLTVIARTNAALGAEPIYSNRIEVRLDGKRVEKSYGDAQPTYLLNFETPQSGDVATYELTVLAWDGQGNSTLRVYTLRYCQINEGDDAGFVTLVLDATTVGLGILDSGTIAVTERETVASVVLRFLEEYGYEADYQGTVSTNFYLRRILRSDLAYRAQVPAELWELILRDGITTNTNFDRDSLGEFDFTQGSGWMYSIQNTLYEGTGMSGYQVRNGITIYLRFTLSYGKDIGGYDATGGGYGALSSYCGVWVNGGYQPLEHAFCETNRLEPTQGEDGYVEYTCEKCGQVMREILPALTGETETEPELPPEPDPALPPEDGQGSTLPRRKQ